MGRSTSTAGFDKDQWVLGTLGESSAAAWYEEMGYEIIQLGYRTRRGEIDVIARAEDGTIVFIEVKTRRGHSFGAAEAVTARKLNRIRAAASEWLMDKPYTPVRFDVVEVLYNGHMFFHRMYQGVEDGAC